MKNPYIHAVAVIAVASLLLAGLWLDEGATLSDSLVGTAVIVGLVWLLAVTAWAIQRGLED